MKANAEKTEEQKEATRAQLNVTLHERPEKNKDE